MFESRMTTIFYHFLDCSDQNSNPRVKVVILLSNIPLYLRSFCSISQSCSYIVTRVKILGYLHSSSIYGSFGQKESNAKLKTNNFTFGSASLSKKCSIENKTSLYIPRKKSWFLGMKLI